MSAQDLIDADFAIWNDPEPASRLPRFAAVYRPDVVVADYAAEVTGFAKVNDLIDRVQRENAGFVFTPEPVVWNHGLGRVVWGYGPPEDPDRVRGEDIFTIREGLLATLHVFIDAGG